MTYRSQPRGATLSHRFVEILWRRAEPGLCNRLIDFVEHNDHHVAGRKGTHGSTIGIGLASQISSHREDSCATLTHPAIDLAFHLGQFGVNRFEDFDLLHW